MKLEPSQFADVPLHANRSTACTPEPADPEWRGILIAAPTRVTLEPVGDGFIPPAPVPICGYFVLDILATRDDGPMRLVLTEAGGGADEPVVRTAHLTPTSRSPRKPPPEPEPVDPELLEGLASGGYFNPDLTYFLPLRPEPAIYEVQVEFAGFTSNTVTIEVVAPAE